jgi:hypothetical protein
MDKALKCVNQALELDPEFDVAKAMRIALRSELDQPEHLNAGFEVTRNSSVG